MTLEARFEGPQKESTRTPASSRDIQRFSRTAEDASVSLFPISDIVRPGKKKTTTVPAEVIGLEGNPELVYLSRELTEGETKGKTTRTVKIARDRQGNDALFTFTVHFDHEQTELDGNPRGVLRSSENLTNSDGLPATSEEAIHATRIVNEIRRYLTTSLAGAEKKSA